MEFTALLIVAYFALLAVALRKRQRKVNGPWLFLLRAFFSKLAVLSWPGARRATAGTRPKRHGPMV